jgi:hypothetical protein
LEIYIFSPSSASTSIKVTTQVYFFSSLIAGLKESSDVDILL